MPSNKDWVPSSRVDQIALAKTMYSEMTQNKKEWGIPGEYMTRFEPLITAADTVLTEAMVQERTKSMTARLNEAFEPLVRCMRDGKNWYLHIPPLTQEQYVRIFGRLKDDTPTSHGPPQAQVGIRVIPLGVRLIKAFFDKLPGSIHPPSGSEWGCAIYEGIMPPGGATLEQAASARRYLMEPPKDGEIMRYRRFTRRSSDQFDYPAEESGYSLFLCARYENGKGEVGPWGPVAGPFIIP